MTWVLSFQGNAPVFEFSISITMKSHDPEKADVHIAETWSVRNYCESQFASSINNTSEVAVNGKIFGG